MMFAPIRLLAAIAISLGLGAQARACSWITAEPAYPGRAEADLQPNRPAPDVRVERVDYFPGVIDTSCDMAVVMLRVSVSTRHVLRASLTFERLPDSDATSPIPSGSFKGDHRDDGRTDFNFVNAAGVPGRLHLRAWTVTPNGRRSEATTFVVEIPAR